MKPAPVNGAGWLPRDDLDRLLDALREEGRTIIGPTVRDGAIVLEEMTSSSDLPIGVRDAQSAGRYRIEDRGDERAFDFASSPMSWKTFTFPASVAIGVATDDDGDLAFRAADRRGSPMAFVGVRACDIAALRVHDDVLTRGPYVDEDYASRRADALIVAVECARPSSTCFCSSMGTGPEVTDGYDLALTELDDGFVVRAGSVAGRMLVERLALADTTPQRLQDAAAVPQQARAVMAAQPGVAREGLRDRLLDKLESPRWEEVAERCLACTNCTMACPTCFCTSVSQTSDLLGHESVARREWASCFTADFASVAGGNFRPRVQDRYRQWLTHKFATWIDQFGTSGCVGCGRCVTWCPVGIDVREELAAIAPVDPAASVPLPRREVAEGLGRYAIGVVTDHRTETADTTTLTVGELPDVTTRGAPGQFLMLELPGFSAAPISISRYRDDSLELTIRAVGASSRAMTALEPGKQIGFRGPLGRGWPLDELDDRDVLIVAGGIGLAPLRPLIDVCLARRERLRSLRLCYGARTPSEILFPDELRAWDEDPAIDVAITVDRGDERWTGPVGVVTQLLDRAPIDGNRASAYLCGPEKMMTASWLALAGRGVMADHAWLSLERHMDCGVGLCGHCQLGRYFVCKDGPVFSRAELGESFDVEGL